MTELDAPIQILLLVSILAGTALLTVGLIVLLLPFLKIYTLAHPNRRSSHLTPTPQGGGIAVIIATLAVISLAAAFVSGPAIASANLLALIGTTALLAIVGGIDDIRTLPVSTRLLVQALCVGALVAVLPSGVSIYAPLPFWIERVLLVIAGVWFINLVNFMDGIDWMMLAEAVPITAAIALFGLMGVVDVLPMLVAVALLGALLGFAPFNKPVAKVFLGDVGSLPIGLLLGWLLLELAGKGYLAAALLLALYYLADATLTLLRRLANREKFWQAHHTHFYQRAIERGFTVLDVVGRVFGANLILAVLAFTTIVMPHAIVSTACLAAGSALVAGLLISFMRGR